MGFTDRAKELADAALVKAGEMSERAAELSLTAREKAPGYVDRAADLTVKAVDATTDRVDQATGGRFHDRLSDAAAKVEQGLDRPRSDRPTEPDVTKQATDPGTPTATDPDPSSRAATDPDDPRRTP